MKPATFVLAAAVAAFALPSMTTTASAYVCHSVNTSVKVHKPTRFKARIQARKSWSYKVRQNHGLAWSVWKIAKTKSTKCTKAGQRWVCKASAKPCKYVPAS
ncbi:MAG: hypothetical protein AAF441_15095 [Pseudomonadota bacterium]